MSEGARRRWRYAPGGGLLLGRGQRWLLLADQPEESVITSLWDALTGQGLDQALAVLDRAYDGRVPDAVGWEAGRTESRGGGACEDGGLTVGLPVEGPWLPLEGGVVAGSAARLVPAEAVPGSRRLIDGIPDDIASSVGPDVPTRFGARDRVRGTDPQPPPPVSPEPQPEPPDPPAAEPPEPEHPDRESSGTIRRAPAEPKAESSDHDGHTMFRRAGAAPPPPGVDHLRQPTHETVLAATCVNGHPTPAYSPDCRVCHAEVPPQEPQRIPRPRLGGLRLPGGEVVALDRGVVIGRRPAPVDDQGEWPQLVTVPPEASYVSRVHLHIQLDGWLVIARDLGSRGGTTLKVPGRTPESIRAHEPHLLEPGHALDLADEYEIVYDVTPELMR